MSEHLEFGSRKRIEGSEVTKPRVQVVHYWSLWEVGYSAGTPESSPEHS